MTKKIFKGGAMLNPLPVVMVSLGKDNPNIITIAWTGIINSDPPMTYISVRPERFSYGILKQEEEFVINLCTEELVRATDYCGVRSGSRVDKFREMNLTPGKCEEVECPLIEESPVNLECRVTEVKPLGSHDMFMAEILKVHIDEELIDEKGRFMLEKAGLAAYLHGEYYGLGRKALGTFGFSVMKAKTKKRRNKEKYEKKRSGRKPASR